MHDVSKGVLPQFRSEEARPKASSSAPSPNVPYRNYDASPAFSTLSNFSQSSRNTSERKLDSISTPPPISDRIGARECNKYNIQGRYSPNSSRGQFESYSVSPSSEFFGTSFSTPISSYNIEAQCRKEEIQYN
jgi:hypothetical protein